MKKHLLFITSLFLLNAAASAQQAPYLQWQKTYSTATSTERPGNVLITKDGGYIMAGAIASGNRGSFDFWIVKTDANGNLQWQKKYSHRDAYAQNIQQTSDGGYIIAGSSGSPYDFSAGYARYNYWVIKIDSIGNIQWQKMYGGDNSDFANAVRQTTDGGYVVAGGTYSNNGDVTLNHGLEDIWIVKLDAAGSLQWQKSFGGKDYDGAHDIQQTLDKGFIIAGFTYSKKSGDVTKNHGKADEWIIKLDSIGNLEWQKTYGGERLEDAYAIQQTADSGYMVAGYASSPELPNYIGGEDYWIFKLNKDGDIEWRKTYGGTYNDEAYSLQRATDGNYIIAGRSYSNDRNVGFDRGYGDCWIIKIDDNGTLLWKKDLGGSYYDYAKDARSAPDGGYIILGSTRSHDGNISGSNHIRSKYYSNWLVKLSPDVLNTTIKIDAYHTAENCTSTNSVSCSITNSSSYTVRLYRFGEIYDSALNVKEHAGFHDLPPGQYYASATDENGLISYSKEVEIVPPPTNLSAQNITAHTAKLTWNNCVCAGDYTIQYRLQGSTEWKEKETSFKSNNYMAENLLPSTTYVWRVASQNRKNGIKAVGKFSDSVTFTTAAAITASTENNISINNTANTVLLNASPNPAKNFFVINFKDDTRQKIYASLHDVNGKTVWSSGLINANTLNGKQVNVSQFAKGVFYLKLINENGELIGSTKIVIAN